MQYAQDNLQFVYRAEVEVEDTILYFLHQAHLHLDRRSGAVRILCLDFSSAFNTIQPLALLDKLIRMQVDPWLVARISSHLIDRPQYVRLNDITSDTEVSNNSGDGAACSPLPPIASDVWYNSELCSHKFADETAILGVLGTTMRSTGVS